MPEMGTMGICEFHNCYPSIHKMGTVPCDNLCNRLICDQLGRSTARGLSPEARSLNDDATLLPCDTAWPTPMEVLLRATPPPLSLGMDSVSRLRRGREMETWCPDAQIQM